MLNHQPGFKMTKDELVDHIVQVHHTYVRNSVPPIEALLEKVADHHGDALPHLPMMKSVFHALKEELFDHMRKEEEGVFPKILNDEDVSLPVKTMKYEHGVIDGFVKELRRLASDYIPPEGACLSFQKLYEMLSAFESDLEKHVQLEDKLFLNTSTPG